MNQYGHPTRNPYPPLPSEDDAQSTRAVTDGASVIEGRGGAMPVVQASPSQTRGADAVHHNKVILVTLTNTPNDTNNNIHRTPLGFQANTVRIENMSGQWYFCHNSQQWIPPYTIGIVLRIPKSEEARMSAITPTTMTSAPATGETLTAIYEVTRFEPRPGIGLTLIQKNGAFA